jgi:hypothetical protein
MAKDVLLPTAGAEWGWDGGPRPAISVIHGDRRLATLYSTGQKSRMSIIRFLVKRVQEGPSGPFGFFQPFMAGRIFNPSGKWRFRHERFVGK